jgi:hypothetical protein
MLAFAVFDGFEVAQQIDESRTGLAIVAAVGAALHLAASTTAGSMLRSE